MLREWCGAMKFYSDWHNKNAETAENEEEFLAILCVPCVFAVKNSNY